MRYLALDFGTRRIGLSFADELEVAIPLPAITQADSPTKWTILATVIRERRPDQLVVGYPINMDGSIGTRAREVDSFIDEIKQRFNLPVARIDERLSSHQAEQDRRHIQGRRLTLKDRQKGLLDSAAATLFLQDHLAQLRSSLGFYTPLGDIVDENQDGNVS